MPDGPFVVAHIGFPLTEPGRSIWIARHLAFGGTARADKERARRAVATKLSMTKLSILSPEEDEAMLREAGFSGVSLFYAGLSFRAWVGYA